MNEARPIGDEGRRRKPQDDEDRVNDEFQQNTLRSRTIRGAAWLGVSQFVGPILQLVQFAALAVLLAPGDYGEWVLPAVVFSTCIIVFEVAIPAAMVTRGAEGNDALTRWLPSVLVCAAVAGALLGPVESSLLWATLPAVALTAQASRFRARLMRDSLFFPIAASEILGGLVSCGVAVLVAWYEGGAWSFVAAGVARQVVVLWLLGRSAKRLPLGAVRNAAAGPIVAYYVVAFLATNVDYLVGSHWLSAHELGLYYVAFNMTTLVVLKLATITNRVSLPLLSGQNEVSWLARARVTLTFSAPICALLAASSWIVVELARQTLPDGRWSGALIPMLWLSIGVAGLGLATLLSTLVLTANGRWRMVTIAILDAATLTGLLYLIQPSSAEQLAQVVGLWMPARAIAWLVLGLKLQQVRDLKHEILHAGSTLTVATSLLFIATRGMHWWLAWFVVALSVIAVILAKRRLTRILDGIL